MFLMIQTGEKYFPQKNYKLRLDCFLVSLQWKKDLKPLENMKSSIMPLRQWWSITSGRQEKKKKKDLLPLADQKNVMLCSRPTADI